MADNFSGYPRDWNSPVLKPIKCVKDGSVFDVPRFLKVGIAGTANLVMADGTVLANYPLVVGYNYERIQAVNAGGTADDIWRCY